MIGKLLEERKLPALKERVEMLRVLAAEEYGMIPPAPASLEIIERGKASTQCGGHAICSEYTLVAKMDGFNVSFPIQCVFPANAPAKSVPTFVLIGYSKQVPNWYFPAQEIAEEGFGVVSFDYNDVAADEEDGFSTGIAPAMVARYGETSKLSLWAWAASRALDYALTREDVDPQKTAVIGHSRLGKTSLWCGANDERFAMVVGNDSGCSGAAISRGKVGESIESITSVFPRWSNGSSYRQYAQREFEAPFDQHWLLACVAPRKLCVGSASEDGWADPTSEYLGCCAADEAWKAMGKTGFVHPDRLPETGEKMQEGDISYHLREGGHYLDRFDWHRYMDFLKQ